MKYNYVIFWRDWVGLYKQSFSDLNGIANARYISSPLTYMSRPKKLLWKLQCHFPHVNHAMGHVLGKLWITPRFYYPSFFVDDFIEKKELVFVFKYDLLSEMYINYISFLKQRYPSSRMVLVFTDLCKTCDNFKEIIERISFDLILSFDQGDCKEYGFIYHPLVFSKFRGVLENMPQSDLYFMGQPKDRLTEIIACLEKLWDNGVKTDVQLVNVPLEQQVYKDRINYIDGWIPYQTNLQHFLHTNCALELMQHGGVGYTQRMCEAIAFDKKIITNNSRIQDAPFYNPKFVFKINSAADITPELCERVKKVEPVDYHYKEQISPIELLEFIEKHL